MNTTMHDSDTPGTVNRLYANYAIWRNAGYGQITKPLLSCSCCCLTAEKTIVYFKLLPLFFLSTVGRLFASISVNINSAMRRAHDVIKIAYNRLIYILVH